MRHVLSHVLSQKKRLFGGSDFRVRPMGEVVLVGVCVWVGVWVRATCAMVIVVVVVTTN